MTMVVTLATEATVAMVASLPILDVGGDGDHPVPKSHGW